MKKSCTILFLTIFLLIGFVFPVNSSDISFEGESDWPMYQYNGQHTGYNENDQISLPLELKWQRRYQDEPFEFNPACIVGDRIVVTNRRVTGSYYPNISIRCLELNNGDVIWSHDFYDYFTLDAPLYYDSTIYCQIVRIGGYLHSFNFLDGTIKWVLPYYVQSALQLSPVIQNNIILFMSGSYGGLTTANAKTGEFIWWKRYGDFDLQAPAVYKDDYFLWQGFYVVQTNIETQQEVQKLYVSNQSLNRNVGSGPLIDTLDHMIFLGHQNYFFAVDLDSMHHIWSQYHPYPTSFATNFNIEMQGLTPALFEDRVYYNNQDTLYCRNKFTGELAWKYATGSWFWSSPIIANGLLFVASRDSTFAFDLATEEKVWSFPVGGQISVGSNHLVLGSIDGELYVFGRVQTDIDDNIVENLPTKYELYQNYPNPFNPETNIEFSLPENSYVTLDIINVAGQKVRTLINQTYSAGNHTVLWNGTNDAGNQLSSGMYLYRLIIEDKTIVKKMILLK